MHAWEAIEGALDFIEEHLQEDILSLIHILQVCNRGDIPFKGSSKVHYRNTPKRRGERYKL